MRSLLKKGLGVIIQSVLHDSRHPDREMLARTRDFYYVIGRRIDKTTTRTPVSISLIASRSDQNQTLFDKPEANKNTRNA